MSSQVYDWNPVSGGQAKLSSEHSFMDVWLRHRRTAPAVAGAWGPMGARRRPRAAGGGRRRPGAAGGPGPGELPPARRSLAAGRRQARRAGRRL